MYVMGRGGRGYNILDNNIDNKELTFSEEEYSDDRQLSQGEWRRGGGEGIRGWGVIS